MKTLLTIVTQTRLFGQILSLAMLIVGVGLVTAVILMPTHLENREMEWQRQFLALQAERIGEQDKAYQQSLEALDRGEPILLERLAYEYLNLKPAETTLVDQNLRIAEDGTKETKRVEDWIRRRLPQVGVDLPPLPQLASHEARLAHVATGRARLPMLILGSALLILGLILPGPGRKSTQPDSANND
jgi:hypothetical protein